MARKGLNIYKRKDGRWEGRVRQNTEQNGRRKYQSVYGSSYAEVREKVILLKTKQDPLKTKCSLTVIQVMEIWLKDKKTAWKESTYASYMRIVESHIINTIGSQKAEDFTNAVFNRYLKGIVKRRDGLKISQSYACNIGAVIRQAFSYVSSEYQYNLPILTVKKSCSSERVREVPEDHTMKRLIDYLYAHAADSTCMGILLAYYTGIRIGELCALTWSDIDLDEGILHINKSMQRIKEYEGKTAITRVKIQSPKTLTSVRSIPIPEKMLSLLKIYRKSPEKYVVEGRRKKWAETRTVQYRFAAILKKCEIRHFKFHMLRHYFASFCVRQGFDTKSLSEILGHANIQITLNLYIHPSMHQKRILMNEAFREIA